MRMTWLIVAILPASLLTASGPARPGISGVAHIALFAKDYEKSRAYYRDFLGLEEAYSLKKPDGSPAVIYFKVNDRQFVELFPEREPNSERLSHLAFQTDSAEDMRLYLKANGISVPDRVTKEPNGNTSITFKDVGGNNIEFVQYDRDGWVAQQRGQHLGASRLGQRIMHIGTIAIQLEPVLRFYRDVLGFRETWRLSRNGDFLNWISLQVPDGEDEFEFQLSREMPPPERRGGANHLCLEIPDVAAALIALELRPYRKQYTGTTPIEEHVATLRKMVSNITDPDGTRTELMQPNFIDGKPIQSSNVPPPR
jgi:catechol 2,3-dioxygenase-like lactoylglutathione lyase family enzyme